MSLKLLVFILRAKGMQLNAFSKIAILMQFMFNILLVAGADRRKARVEAERPVKKRLLCGAPGWLSWLRVQPLISVQVMISQLVMLDITMSAVLTA